MLKSSKLFMRLKEGTYSCTLRNWDSVTSKSGVDGISLTVVVEDANNGGALREKQILCYGYKAEETLEGLCTQFNANFETIEELMEHFKKNKAVGHFTNDGQYDQWAF